MERDHLGNKFSLEEQLQRNLTLSKQGDHNKAFVLQKVMIIIHLIPLASGRMPTVQCSVIPFFLKVFPDLLVSLHFFNLICTIDCLCALVVRVSDYRSRGPGSIPGATRFSEK
jgi:hypothetical protein